MGHYRSAGKPGARSFEYNQPVEALVNFNFAEFESSQKAKDLHVELPKMLPEFLKEKPTSALMEINKRMMEQILAFARAGHHQRVYVVIEFTYTDKPGVVTWNQHLFGYGDRGIAFKLAKKLHQTVQIYDFGGPL